MSNLLRSLIVRVGADLSDFDKGMKSMSKQLKTTGKELTSTGESLTKGLTLPIAAAAAASIKYASDMGETLSKTKQTFKGSADDVLNWSETSLTAFGLAKASALDIAATYGDMGTSMGLATGTAADMSKNLVGLAADLASFKNIGVDQASAALRGIFTGEGEALKTLGVVMQESTLEAYALAQGTTKTYKEMELAEKVMLRYKYVNDATKNAQGDFARTSDSTANQMRITAESAKEAAAALGENLLPMITPVITKLNEGIKAFAAMDDGQKKAVVTFALLAAGIGPVTTGLGKVTTTVSGLVSNLGKASKAIQSGGGLTSALATMINPAGLAVVAIGALAAAFGFVYLESQKAADKAVEAVQAIEDKALAALEEQKQKEADIINKAINDETTAYNKRLETFQKDNDSAVKSEEAWTKDSIEQINLRKEALENSHDIAIQKIRDEYGVASTAAKSRTDIVIERYEAEADAARTTYDEKIKAAEDAYNTETEAAKKRYDEEVKAAESAYDRLNKESKKRYDTDKKLAEDRYDDETKKYKTHHDNLVKEAKILYDADVKAARTAYEERTKAAKSAYDLEVDSAKKAHTEKMALLDAELNRSKDRIDRASSLAVGDLEDRIALLDGSTAEEVAIERKKRQEQRAIELEGLIAAERDETEKAKIISERTGIVQQIVAESADKQLELQRWAIREQILAEKQKAADLKATEEAAYAEKATAYQAQLDEQLQTLTDSYNKQAEEYQNNLDAQLAAFEAFYNDQVTQLDILLDETTASRKAALETQIADLQTKLDEETSAHKTALDNQTAALDEQLKTQLESYQTNLDNKKAALDTSLAGQLAALDTKKKTEIAIIQEERIAKEAAETEKYNATKNSFDDQLAEHERMLSDQKKLLDKELQDKKDHEKALYDEAKKRLDDELADLEQNIQDKQKAVENAFDMQKQVVEKNKKDEFWAAFAAGGFVGAITNEEYNKNQPKNPDAAIPQLPGTDNLIPGYKVPFYIPSYDVGTNYVPRDGLAMLHKGEVVVPAAYNNDNGIIRESPINITNNIYTEAAAKAAANEFERVLTRRGYPGVAR